MRPLVEGKARAIRGATCDDQRDLLAARQRGAARAGDAHGIAGLDRGQAQGGGLAVVEQVAHELREPGDLRAQEAPPAP